MAKAKTVFFCQECGYESAKWMGQCPGCRAWNSFVEEPVTVKTGGRAQAARDMVLAVPTKLSDVSLAADARIHDRN